MFVEYENMLFSDFKFSTQLISTVFIAVIGIFEVSRLLVCLFDCFFVFALLKIY